MMNKMQSIEQVELLSQILTEQTEEVIMSFGENVCLDDYVFEEIQSLEVCDGTIEFIYQDLPSIKFDGVSFKIETNLKSEIDAKSIIAIGVNLVGNCLRVRLIIETRRGKNCSIKFDAKKIKFER